MSHTAPSYGIIASPVASCNSSTFLSPPETPTSEGDVPFKPLESDSTSLDMKARHKNDSLLRHRKGPRKTMTSKNPTSKRIYAKDTNVAPVSRTKSTSVLSLSVTAGHQWENEGRPWQTTPATDCHPRRWTLPTKSMPTRGLTNLQPTVKQACLDEGKESPAMITLRRATTTTGNKARERTSITFFPEPIFSKHRPNLFSYLASTFTGESDSQSHPNPLLAETFHSSSSTSVENVSVRAAIGSAAQPVQTVTSMEPTITIPGTFSQAPMNRRCSTKYISDMSMYEIIWDQNDTSSAETDSSRPSVGSQTNVRRRSMAVEQLETQLLRSEAQSRRTSHHQEESSRKSSSAAGPEQSMRKSFQGIIDLSLSSLINEAALKNLPRSKASKISKQPPPIIESAAAIHLTFSEESNNVTWCENELFPPLSCRESNHCEPDPDESQSKGVAVATHRNSVALQAPASIRRLGSLVGSSSHMRRRSTQVEEDANQNLRNVCGQVAKDTRKPRTFAGDQLPLLNPLTWEEQSPW